MKRLLPGRIELCLLAILAILATVVVGLLPVTDLAMAGLSIPLFIAAALIGLRRSPEFSSVRVEAARERETVERL